MLDLKLLSCEGTTDIYTYLTIIRTIYEQLEKFGLTLNSLSADRKLHLRHRFSLANYQQS